MRESLIIVASRRIVGNVLNSNDLETNKAVIRIRTEKVIENARFSLFLSNPNFEDVSNHVFFNDLSKKINKRLLVIPFEKNNQLSFTKAHNYYILY